LSALNLSGRRRRPIAIALTALVAIVFALAIVSQGPALAQDYNPGAIPDQESMRGDPDEQTGGEGSGDNSEEGTQDPNDQDGDGCANSPYMNGPYVTGEPGKNPCDDPKTEEAEAPEDSDDQNAEELGESPGSCKILGTIDVCAPVLAAIKAVLDGAWEWIVGITEDLAEWVMGTAFTLPSMEGPLLDKYDAMVDTVKPAIVVGILLLALGMMLSPTNVTAQHAILHGLPKIALVALALAFFPEFVRMMTDVTSALGTAFGEEAEVGAALAEIMQAAGIFAAAATVFTANPTTGAIVAGLIILPLIVLLVIIFAVGVFLDYLFALLVLIGPVCIVCWPVYGLQTVATVWFRAVLACFLIPVLFSVEAAVGSWIVASPELLATSAEGKEAAEAVLGTVCLVLLIIVMYATPKKVLDWAFGASMGGSFSFKGAKSAAQSFAQDFVKNAATTVAPHSNLAKGASRMGGKGRGLSAAMAGAAGGAAGAAAGQWARGQRWGGFSGGGNSGGAGSEIERSSGGRRGLRGKPEDPLASAKEAMSDEKARKNVPDLKDPRKTGGLKAARDKGAAAAPGGPVQNPENAQGAREAQNPQTKRQAEGEGKKLLADSAAYQKAVAKQNAEQHLDAAQSRFEETRAGGALGAEGISHMDVPETTTAPSAASGEGGLSAGTPSAWEENLAENGHGERLADAVGRDARASAGAARQAAYDRTFGEYMGNHEARAAESVAQERALRQQANAPGVSGDGRRNLRDQADTLQAQRLSQAATASDDAHRAAERAGDRAMESAVGTYAGAAAHEAGLRSQRAAGRVAYAEASRIGEAAQRRADVAQRNARLAHENLRAAETQYDAAAGTATDNSSDLPVLRQRYAQAKEEAQVAAAEAKAWQPGGAEHSAYVEHKAKGAYMNDYKGLYERASGNAAQQGGSSPGYDPRPVGGPPRFGGSFGLAPSRKPEDPFDPYGPTKPTWTEHRDRI